MLMRPSKLGRIAVPRNRKSTSPDNLASVVCTVSSGADIMRTSSRRLLSGDAGFGTGTGCVTMAPN